MNEPDIDLDDFPSLLNVGHGRYRLSWWEPNVLGGVEIWPDRPTDDPSIPQGYYVLRIDKPRSYSPNGGARHGFRRRCGWCGVVLRGWQLNLCRTCKRHAGNIPLPGRGLGSAPYPSGSHWNATPDRWRRGKPD